MTAIKILDWSLLIAWVPLCFLYAGVVRGTKYSYIITSLLILVTALDSVVMSIRTALYLMQDDFIGASLTTITVLILGILLTRIIRDDNWFNKQGKRLKKGIKNLQSSLQSAFMPVPAPS